jgi:hypothetical protein
MRGQFARPKDDELRSFEVRLNFFSMGSDDDEIRIDWKRLEEEERAAEVARDRWYSRNYQLDRLKSFVSSVFGCLLLIAVFLVALFILVRLIRAFWYA